MYFRRAYEAIAALMNAYNHVLKGNTTPAG